MDPFEPTWKKETESIRRTLHIVTYIHDEFLDSSGNVIKELRFEKRSLQPPVTVIPAWIARRSKNQSIDLIEIPENHAPTSPIERERTWRPVVASNTLQQVPDPQSFVIPDVTEIPKSPEGSQLESFVNLAELAGSVQVKNFAFWDCPPLRTSQSKLPSRVYIPVYVHATEENTSELEVIVNPASGKCDKARSDDLIYLSELQPYQTVHHWKGQRIGDEYPNIRTISLQGSKPIAFYDPVVSESGECLDLLLNVGSDPGKKVKRVSFWECMLPCKAVVVRRTDVASSATSSSQKNRGDLPEDILAKKRNKPVDGSRSTMQRLLLDLADTEDDDTVSSKRPRIERDIVPAQQPNEPNRSSTSAETPQSSRLSEKDDIATLYSALKNFKPCKNLFSEFVFATFFDRNAPDMPALENLITESDGRVVTGNNIDQLREVADRPRPCVIADKFQRRPFYAQAIIAGVPIVNLVWLIDCLSSKRIVQFDKKRHLIKSVSMLGFEKDQPYAKPSERKRPLSSLYIGIAAQSPDMYIKLSGLANGLGANARSVTFDVSDDDLAKQVDKVDYILSYLGNKEKLSRLYSVTEDIPIVTFNWLFDCATLCHLVDYKSNVGYFHSKPS